MTIRRTLDAVIGLGGIALAAPAMLLVAAYLRVVAGAPVIFVQPRATLGGRVFRLVKFRTMVERRDSAGALLPDGARLVPGGHLLRASRLDELPQFWHVLVGDMSLIGPRPLLPETVRAAGDRGRARSSVRPGLTGWAQVNGNTLLSTADKLALDLWYIEHRSIGLDLLILARTLLVPIKGERLNALAIGRAHAGDHRRSR